VILRQPLVHRRRQQVDGVSIYSNEAAHAVNVRWNSRNCPSCRPFGVAGKARQAPSAWCGHAQGADLKCAAPVVRRGGPYRNVEPPTVRTDACNISRILFPSQSGPALRARGGRCPGVC
jgi:hypothetical protein